MNTWPSELLARPAAAPSNLVPKRESEPPDEAAATAVDDDAAAAVKPFGLCVPHWLQDEFLFTSKHRQ